jgi:hypothetical protein
MCADSAIFNKLATVNGLPLGENSPNLATLQFMYLHFCLRTIYCWATHHQGCQMVFLNQKFKFG